MKTIQDHEITLELIKLVADVFLVDGDSIYQAVAVQNQVFLYVGGPVPMIDFKLKGQPKYILPIIEKLLVEHKFSLSCAGDAYKLKRCSELGETHLESNSLAGIICLAADLISNLTN